MKRYIKSARGRGQDVPYSRKRAHDVLVELLRNRGEIQLAESLALDDILSAKWADRIVFHHVDGDTGNNTEDNIRLMPADAHSFLHNAGTEDKLVRMLYDNHPPVKIYMSPGYNRLISEMYSEVDKWLNYKGRVDSLLDRICALGPDATSSQLRQAFDRSESVTRSDIENLLTESGIDFRKPADIIYVDSETADKLLRTLAELYQDVDDNSMVGKSIATVCQFIRENQVTREELSKLYNNGVTTHPNR